MRRALQMLLAVAKCAALGLGTVCVAFGETDERAPLPNPERQTPADLLAETAAGQQSAEPSQTNMLFL